MSKQSLFNDLSKTIDDFFKKAHTFDSKATLKAKGADGLVFSAESKIVTSKKSGASSAATKVGLKFSPCSWLNVSKMEYNNAGRFDVELDSTYADIKAVLKSSCGRQGIMNPEKDKEYEDAYTVSAEYLNVFEGVGVAAHAECEVAKKKGAASLCLSYDGFFVGGGIGTLPQFAGIEAHAVSLGYQSRAGALAVLKGDNMKKFTFSYLHKLDDSLTFGLQAVHCLDEPAAKEGEKAKETPAPTISIGGSWALDKSSKIVVDVNEKAVVQATFTNTVTKGVDVALSSSFSGITGQLSKAGAGLSFSF